LVGDRDRRVPNLEVLFSRHDETLAVSRGPSINRPGDIVTCEVLEKRLVLQED
jgi:uncharacterized protein YijF (DUF1287 family)